MRCIARRGAEAPALLVSLLVNLGIVYLVGTALVHRPPVFERIEVDLRERSIPRPPQLHPPSHVSRPPEAPVALPLPHPTPVPQKLVPTRAETPPAPRPSVIPTPISVPAVLPSSVAVPLHLARKKPPAPIPALPAQASVSPEPPTPPVPKAVTPRPDRGLLEAYFAQLRARIEAQKRYPRWARKVRLEGRTTVSFRLAADGTLLGVAVAESSGHDSLDQAAVDAVRRAAPFPAFPGRSWEMPEILKVPVIFVLK